MFLSTPVNKQTVFQKDDSLNIIDAPKTSIQAASSEVTETFSERGNDDNVIVIHEHHHHHHHKNVTDNDENQSDDYDYDEDLVSNSGDDIKAQQEVAKPTYNSLAYLMAMLIDRQKDSLSYHDEDEQEYFQDENDRRSAAQSKSNVDERKYKRIAEIYRELYSDYYTAYVKKAGYEANNQEIEDNDGIEKFVENGYQPIVEFELDL